MGAVAKIFGGGKVKPQPVRLQPDRADPAAREAERRSRAEAMSRQGRESTNLSGGSFMSQYLGN